MVERRLAGGFTVSLPPSSGAVTFEFRKNPAEMALVDEAAYQSNVCQLQPVSEQQLPSPLDSFSNQPLVWRYIRRLASTRRSCQGDNPPDVKSSGTAALP
jgi:hypothetical protein